MSRWPVTLRRPALRRAAITALGTVAAVGAAVACIDSVFAFDARYQSAGQPAFVDWLTYSNAFERFMDGEPLYAPKQLEGPYLLPRAVTTGYAYPPSSIVLFAPFSGGSVGLLAWLLVSATLVWSAVTALAHRAFGLPVVWAAAATAITLAPFVPLSTGLATGNANVGLAGLIGWAWIGVGRWWVAPAAGLGATLKVYPALLAGWAARWQGPQAFINAVAPALALGVLTLPFVGIGSWLDYVTALRNAEPACWPGTASVACVLEPALGAGAAKIVGIVLGVVLLVAGMWAPSRYLAFVLITLGMLAPVTDGWIHYGLFAYVLVFVGLDHVFRRGAALHTRVHAAGRRAPSSLPSEGS